MCNKRIVSRKIFIAIASVFYPVDVTKNRKRLLAIILNWCVLQLLKRLLTILSILIWFTNPLHCQFFNGSIVSGKIFQVISSVVVLVGMTKNCKWFNSDIFLNCYELKLLEWLFTIPSILIRFKIPLKQSTFNKRIVSGKTLKAIWSMVFPVGLTKNF